MTEDKKIEHGDVVEHRLFGVGKVIDVQGERLEIEFEEKGLKRVVREFVCLREKGAGKGLYYWHKEWTRLVDEWLEARRQAEEVLSQLFRPVKSDAVKAEKRFRVLLQKEDKCRSRIDQFLADETRGEHK